MEPVHQRIVAELRGRIDRGELAVGDRVPSTRELTRQWGVAMATATKALTALRHEGLVHAVPGVGTVVAGGRPAAVRSRAERGLAVGQIVVAAIRIADAEGLTAVSMRRVAAELGVATMALYRHVADKDDLLVRMLDAVLEEWRVPATPPAGWRATLELAARDLWATCRRHPWLGAAISITRPQAIPAGMAHTNHILTTLDGLGLDHSEMLRTHLTLVNFVRGIASSLELEADAEAVTGLGVDAWLAGQEPALLAVLGRAELPMLERVMREDLVADLDSLFETGLCYLLDGIAVRLGPDV